MRSRLLVVARFAAYALILAVGVHHLLGRADANEPSKRPVLEGRTTQGLPITLWTSSGRVSRVELEWRSTCESGRRIEWRHFFNDSHPGDWKRSGQGFHDHVYVPYGPRFLLEGRVDGVAEDGVARGSVHLKLTRGSRGQVTDVCESGSIGFAIDLPR